MGLRAPGSCSLGSSEVGSSHDSGFAISMLGPADTVGAPQLLSPDGVFLPLCHPGSPCGVCGPENCPPHCEADAVSTAQQQRHSWLSPTVCSDAHQALESRTAQRQHRHRVGIPRSPRSVVGPPPCRGPPPGSVLASPPRPGLPALAQGVWPRPLEVGASALADAGAPRARERMGLGIREGEWPG